MEEIKIREITRKNIKKKDRIKFMIEETDELEKEKIVDATDRELDDLNMVKGIEIEEMKEIEI